MWKWVIPLLLFTGTYWALATSALVDVPRPREYAQVQIHGALFTVEIPNTPYRTRRGLQGRKELSSDSGMLFVFPENLVVPFWMKDTLIPLDMIWLDDKLIVTHIEQDAPPCIADPCPHYGSDRPARFVLEVNAGHARLANISIGDQAVVIPGG